MTVAFYGVGAAVSGTSPLALPLPGPYGKDQLVLVPRVTWWNSPFSPVVDGWNRTADLAGGEPGVGAADNHPSRITVDHRILRGNEAPTAEMVSYTAGTGAPVDGALGQTVTYTKGAGAWNIAAATGTDNTHGTDRTAVASTPLSLAPGDVLVAFVAVDTDAAGTITPAFTAASITFSAVTTRANNATTQGFDGRMLIVEATVTAGTATVAPTYSHTTTLSQCGPVAFVRLREDPAIVSGWRPSTVDLLNLRNTPRRFDNFRFELCDQRNRRLGDLFPDLDQNPTVTWDTSRETQRSLDNFYLPAGQIDDINKLTDRVRVYMNLQDGAEYSLGVFLWVDANEPRRRWGYESEGTLLDKTYILNQPQTIPSGMARYERALVTMYTYITGFPEFNRDYLSEPDLRNADPSKALWTLVSMDEGASSKELGSPVNWQGGTTHLRIINDTLAIVGYLPLYADRNGIITIRNAAPIDTVPTSLSYELAPVTEHAAVADANARIGFLGIGITFVRTSDVPAQDVDLDVAFEVNPTNPQPTGFSIMGGRWAPGAKSWQAFLNNTTARFGLNISADGTASTTMNFSTFAVPFSRASYRITYQANNGAGQHVARLYTGPVDGPWTLVETNTVSGAVSLFPSTAPLTVGSDPDVNNFGLLGSMYAYRYRDGIDGRVLAGWNAAELPHGTGAFYGAEDGRWDISWASIFNDSRAGRTTWERGRIIEESIVRSGDHLTAPNYVVIVDTAANQTPIRGVWRAPASAPHSEARRGGVAIGKYISRSGFASQEEADLAAQREGEYLLGAGDWVQWQSSADPRHDAFEVLTVLGNKMLEVAHAIVCVPGQPMRHKALRVYPREGQTT